MARLIVIDGPDLGNEYELERPDSGELANVILGRDPRVEVPLQDSAISREHCRVEISPGGCRLVDLGSRNKTFLNGDPVEQSWLKDGDLLVIGDSELRFEDEAQLVEVGGVASTIIKEIEPCAGSPSPVSSSQSHRPTTRRSSGASGPARSPSCGPGGCGRAQRRSALSKAPHP